MDQFQLLGSDLLSWRKKQLEKGGRVCDFDWLLDLAAGISWSDIQRIRIDPDSCIFTQESLQELECYWDIHLSTKMPLQYLLGRCPWRDFELEVTSAALIPRQETEILVDLALDLIDKNVSGNWVDLGTGSGAIAVALSRALPLWQGHAVDLSAEAISLARKNLKRLAPNSQCHIYCGDWWDPLKSLWGKLSLAVVNPPYIPDSLLDELPLTVRKHEPHLALLGGLDGLVASRKVISQGINVLSPGGYLCIEHHYDQSDQIISLLQNSGYSEVSFEKDLEGVRRFATARRPH